MTIHIVGGGLAGTECALQLANRGFQVCLYEMRQGGEMTPAHKTDQLAEIVCSNSFGSLAPTSAPGQLKREALELGSHILSAGIQASVPAGQALGIDRHGFSQQLTLKVQNHPNIQIIKKQIHDLSEVPRPCVVATGPLTGEGLSKSLQQHFGDDFLYFFDAIAPVVDADTIDPETSWRQDRWDKGTGDYLNCGLNKEQYEEFITALLQARKIEPKDFEKNTPYFESCLPVEVIAERGLETLRFGPMSPKGLRDPKEGRRPHAVVQLRQENRQATAYNLVGFQTKMAYADQKEVFRKIPALKNAEFVKLGGIHRNLYIHTPKRLNKDLSSKKDPLLFFAGQITGVEGYFESTCIGILVSLFVEAKIKGLPTPFPPRDTALGSLMEAITEEKDRFQPTNINFSLFPRIEGIRDPRERKNRQIAIANLSLKNWTEDLLKNYLILKDDTATEIFLRMQTQDITQKFTLENGVSIPVKQTQGVGINGNLPGVPL